MAQPAAANDQSFVFSAFSIFFENLWLTIGSLTAALVIWFYISSKVQENINLPADLQLNVPEDYVITETRFTEGGAPVNDQVDVPLYGPVSDLQQIKRNRNLDVEKQVPVSDMTESEKTIPVRITEKDLRLRGEALPIGIHMDPRSIELQVSVEKKRTESRPVLNPTLQENIDLFTRGRPLADHRISNVTSQISTVDVTGPVNTLEHVRLVPVQPVNVTGKASTITSPVTLEAEVPARYASTARHVSISPEQVNISVEITSQMTTRTINVPFRISTGPELRNYLEARNWAFSPEDRMLTITLQLPKSIDKESLTPDQIHPILILPEDDIQELSDPTVPLRAPSETYIHVFISRSVQDRDKIQVQKIKPDSIKFAPKEKS